MHEVYFVNLEGKEALDPHCMGLIVSVILGYYGMYHGMHQRMTRTIPALLLSLWYLFFKAYIVNYSYNFCTVHSLFI